MVRVGNVAIAERKVFTLFSLLAFCRYSRSGSSAPSPKITEYS